MSYPTSPVDICNLALDHLKEGNITSIETPNTKVEVICSNWYDQTRRSLLRRHTWNFATKRISLARLTTTPAFGWNYEYQLPNDFIRFVSIGENYPMRSESYQIEDSKILIDDSLNTSGTDTSLKLRYIYDFTNVSAMDPLFIEIFAIELAINISYRITGSNTTKNELGAMLRELNKQAYAIDGQERPPTRVERSRVLRKRRAIGTDTASHYIYDEEL